MTLAASLITDVLAELRGAPTFLVGSLVAEETYGLSDAHSDVDLFCPSEQVLIAVGQQLIDHGYTLDDRFSRVWARWLRYGFNKWHTNSLRLNSPSGVETNVVYKIADGHPTTSMAQVIESFDFGLLATGYETETGQFRDMRGYLFPGFDLGGPFPMMPSKRDNWRAGYISQYNGIRQTQRYVKYSRYGYDLSLVKDDLVTGYRAAALYFTTHFDPKKQALSVIYSALADHIELDSFDELDEAFKLIDYSDELDVIMEALT